MDRSCQAYIIGAGLWNEVRTVVVKGLTRIKKINTKYYYPSNPNSQLLSNLVF